MIRRPMLAAALGLVAAEAWLALIALPAIWQAGDRTGLPLAAWLMPVAATIAPWVFDRGVRPQAAWLGQAGAVAAAGVMIVSAPLGAALALAWIGLRLVGQRGKPRATS